MSPEIAEIQQRWSQMSEAEFARLKKGDLRQDVQPYFDLELERRRNLGENTESCLASDAAVSAPDGEVSRDASEPGWLTMEREYFCNSCQTETRHEAQQRKWWMFVFGKPNARTVNGVLPWTVVLVLAACTAGIGAVVVLFFFGPLLQVLSAVAGEKLSPTPRRCSICQTALDPLEMSRNTKGAAVSDVQEEPSTFGDWYRRQLGNLPMAVQAILWFFYGFIWIPAWYWSSQRRRGVSIR